VRAICQQKFTELLESEGIKVQRTGIVEVPYVQKKSDGNEGGDDSGEAPVNEP
jgi:hypothetical protein